MIKRITKAFPIYDSIQFDIIISDSNKEVSESLRPEDRDPTYWACVSRTYVDNPKFPGNEDKTRKAITVILCIEDYPMTEGVIVHEAVHVKNKVFDTVGMKNDTNNDEHEAYFVEWIYNKISKEFKKFKKERDEQNIAAGD